MISPNIKILSHGTSLGCHKNNLNGLLVTFWQSSGNCCVIQSAIFKTRLSPPLKKATYNIADFVNKIAFVLACWSCAKTDSAAKGNPLLPQ